MHAWVYNELISQRLPKENHFSATYNTLTCVSSILLGDFSMLLPKAHAFHLPQEENHVLGQAKDE